MIRSVATVTALFIALSLAGAARAQDEPADKGEWSAFFEDSYAAITREDLGWETSLYKAVEASGTPDDVVPMFAAAIGASPTAADLFAHLIVDAVAREEADREGACDAECQWLPGSPAFSRFESAVAEEPTGALLIGVAKNLTSTTPAEWSAVLDVVVRHPARDRVLGELYEYTRDADVLARFILASPLSPGALKAMRRTPGDDVDLNEPFERRGWLEAALLQGLEGPVTASRDLETRAVYVQLLASRYLGLRLPERAVDLYLTQPTEVLALLPLDDEPCMDLADHCADASVWFVDEMSAALWTAGRHDAADALMARAGPRLDDRRTTQQLQIQAALTDAMRPRIPEAALFELLIDGDASLKGRQQSYDHSEPSWFLTGHGPAGRRLLAQRVADAGYPAMAAELLRRRRPYISERSDEESGKPATTWAALQALQPLQAAISADIEAMIAAFGKTDDGITPASPPLPDPWTETRLAPSVSPWGEDEESGPAPVLPDWISPYSVRRSASVDGETFIVFLSGDLDPSGELPAAGVWLARGQGGWWDSPIYLGLQEHFPYVVTSGSRLPLVSDGKVQLEVRIAEIDPDSITFPPVGLRMKREESGVVLTSTLAELQRDSDGDGLTDLMESRLALDPVIADTDGDGQTDGVDPMPLTPHGQPDPARDAMGLAILEAVVGYEADGIVVPVGNAESSDVETLIVGVGRPPPALETLIFVGDPAPFSGLDLPFRLLVYTQEQAEVMTRGRGPFYPPSIRSYPSLDGLSRLVIWSAGWAGGTFVVRCTAAGACETQTKSSWIT